MVAQACIGNFRSQGNAKKRLTALQMTMGQLGEIPGPITGPEPTNVTGELDLTQGFGTLDNGTALTRGYVTVASSTPYFSTAGQVRLQETLSVGCAKTMADPAQDFHCALSLPWGPTTMVRRLWGFGQTHDCIDHPLCLWK